MGSQTSRKEADTDIAYASYIPRPPTPKILLLGPSDCGKSTLFRSLKSITSGNENLGSCESDIQTVSSWVIERLLELMNDQEKTHFKELFKDVECVKQIFRYDSLSGFEDTSNLRQALCELWKNPLFKDFYESNWTRVFDNVQEFITKAESNQIFDPFSLIHPRTTGIIENRFTVKNTEYSILDVGGRRNERRKWIHCFDSVETLIYVVSISEFDQVLTEDYNTNRVEESITLIKEVCDSRWFAEARKIILFTKPDILLKKLQKGIIYNREVNYTIRPELAGIAQEKVVVNSIVNEYLKKLEGVKIDSYHIVNLTVKDEVKSVFNMLFGEKSSQKTNFISPCLLLSNNRMKLSLYNNCLNQRLVDLQIITLTETLCEE